ncbi:MAG TPA: hypothetical protein VHJ17_07335 [Thermomonospora sp.]|nr:hypothetical protein [Thermomonospora sp.]
MSATGDDGTTSGLLPVHGQSGARYFGFHSTGPATLKTIKVTSLDTSGFAIGEFGISS